MRQNKITIKLEDDTKLFSSGLFTSMDMLEIVLDIESNLGLDLSGKNPEDFDSINDILLTIKDNN